MTVVTSVLDATGESGGPGSLGAGAIWSHLPDRLEWPIRAARRNGS